MDYRDSAFCAESSNEGFIFLGFFACAQNDKKVDCHDLAKPNLAMTDFIILHTPSILGLRITSVYSPNTQTA